MAHYIFTMPNQIPKRTITRIFTEKTHQHIGHELAWRNIEYFTAQEIRKPGDFGPSPSKLEELTSRRHAEMPNTVCVNPDWSNAISHIMVPLTDVWPELQS